MNHLDECIDDEIVQNLLTLAETAQDDAIDDASVLEDLLNGTDDNQSFKHRNVENVDDINEDIGIFQELLNSTDDFKNVTSDNEICRNASNNPVLKDCNILSTQQNPVANLCTSTVEVSAIHRGDTDSSDDEDNKYFHEEKYNSCGKELKQLFKDSSKDSSSRFHDRSSSLSWRSSNNDLVPPKPSKNTEYTGLCTDPLFGIRIVNPLMSSIILKERMNGRQVIQMDRVKAFVVRGPPKDCDWIVGGVIVLKSEIKTSQKGKQYVLWKLSDLKHGLKSISVFLFGNSFKQHWKTSVGTIVAILNPKVMEGSDGNDIEATFSVDNSLKVLIIGTAKDFGYCKAKKKNGQDCSAFVNKNDCEYCTYHIMQGYKQYTQYSKLRPSSEGGGGLINLRNKVLGKNEVFYGGQSFTAVPAQKSRKITAKDKKTLQRLSDFGNQPKLECNSMSDRSKAIFSHNVYSNHMRKDAERLHMLSNGNVTDDPVNTLSEKSTVLPSSSQNFSTNEQKNPSPPHHLNKLQKENKLAPPLALTPKLGSGLSKSGVITFTSPARKDRLKAKLNALAYVQKNGPIQKGNTIGSRKSVDKSQTPIHNKPSEIMQKKRLPDTIKINDVKKAKQEPEIKNESPADFTKSSRFKELMNMTSKHKDLLEANDIEAEDAYFEKLEKKEKLEEKMLTTYKVPCKAVCCIKCKYTSFSASDNCKVQAHPLKVIDAVKRFFKCGDCGNRTVSLNVIPLNSCKTCSGSHWLRAPMMRERKDGIESTLSIRGDEETFIGSVHSGGNLNLLAPDDE